MHFLSALLMLRENGNSPQEVVKDKDCQDNRDNKWGLEKNLGSEYPPSVSNYPEPILGNPTHT